MGASEVQKAKAQRLVELIFRWAELDRAAHLSGNNLTRVLAHEAWDAVLAEVATCSVDDIRKANQFGGPLVIKQSDVALRQVIAKGNAERDRREVGY